VLQRHVPEPVRRVVRPEVAAELRSMLRGVVYPEGTGSTAALTSYELAGKTGTARRAGNGGYIPGAYFATFASLFPAENPQLVMVVKLDDPRGAYARVTAAPVTRAVIEQVLAARTGALDPGVLGVMQPLAATEPVVGGGSAPYVVSWPLVDSAAEAVGRRVPNPDGLTLRAAARLLHRSGFQVRIRGWGKVTRVVPAPGSVQRPGTVVTVFAEGDGRP
jgi:membrane peptidoglycan carboxypeptidase